MLFGQLEALLQGDAGLPLQDPLGSTLVEPVGRRHLLGQEARNRGFITASFSVPERLDNAAGGFG